MTPFPILFEDGEALVIDKPAGLPLDRPRAGGASLEDRVHELRLGFERSPWPVHRLDQDTSGCLLMARNAKALKRFSAAFEAREVEKVYLGIVAGLLEQDAGTIDLALSKISSAEKGWRMIAAKKGKPSITHWRKIAVVGGHTLVEFRPETGRTHQIRIHALAGLGAPLVGDPIYGTGPNAPGGGAARTMLHASALTVRRGEKPPIVAHAPLPEDFRALGFGEAEPAGEVQHLQDAQIQPDAQLQQDD
jgi:tRNA pseudouridine32 synthase/23S rRNA pseudouridine746 synthase